ncbi:MAG: type II toxin-antitoxin system HicA family toxin [Anaerolineae bacterium]|nr:type II toxin-antitoxin system HicA family toxin [Anaerolineae bacterium]
MSRLPVISGRECVRALERAGFYLKRQTGSHMVLRREEPFAQVVVPDHRAIIRHAALSVEEFVDLLT